MAGETIVVQATPEQNLQETETQITQAVAYGQMTEAFRQSQLKQAELEVKLENQSQVHNQTLELLNRLKSQMDGITRQTENLNASQTAIISTMGGSGNEENEEEVQTITPHPEVITEEEAMPAPQRSTLQKFLFGK